MVARNQYGHKLTLVTHLGYPGKKLHNVALEAHFEHSGSLEVNIAQIDSWMLILSILAAWAQTLPTLIPGGSL